MRTPRERPILFSAPMVRALRDGAKTETRRILRPQPVLSGASWQWRDYIWCSDKKRPVDVLNGGSLKPCPYGAPGDRLWVRETWRRTTAGIRYRADCRGPDGEAAAEGKWRAAIHMPREASRLLLEVVGVRVEHVRNIAEADAVAEGVVTLYHRHDGEAVDTLRRLWGGLHGPDSWPANPWVWVIRFRRVDD